MPVRLRLTIAFAIFPEVAVLPRVTAPVLPETVMPPPPVRPRTPLLSRVRAAPRETTPPPVNPAPVLSVKLLLASLAFVTAPSASAFFEDVLAGRAPAATCENELPVRPVPRP